MKRILIFFAFIVAANNICAQAPSGTFSVIPSIGVTLAKISNDQNTSSVNASNELLLSNSKSKAGMTVGADVQYQFNEFFALSAGVHYQQMGASYDDTDLSKATPGEYTVTRNQRLHLQYLGVPILAHCYVANGLAINFGLQASWLLDNRLKYEQTKVTIGKDGSYTYQPTTDKTSLKSTACNNIDLAIPFGISYEYQNVILDARYMLGVSKLYKSSVDLDGNNRALLLSVEYKFDINKL